MALTMATNIGALNAAAAAASTTRSMETSMERLSSGKRINSASDDVSGVGVSSRMTSEIRGSNQSIRNALDAQALVHTADGAHKEIDNILQRMREVAVQAANDTNNDQDRSNLQAEMDAMVSEVDRIASNTTWAGANLMQADAGTSFSFMVGAAPDITSNEITVDISSMTTIGLDLAEAASSAFTRAASDITSSTETIADVTTASFEVTGASLQFNDDYADTSATMTVNGVSATLTGNDSAADVLAINAAFASQGISASVDLANEDDAADGAGYITLAFSEVASTSGTASLVSVEAGSGNTAAENARAGVVLIDEAIKTVNIQRSELGAVSNRLNHTVNNLTNISSNLSAAKGGIEDADFALETTNLAKNQILQQASTAMLAQANASKQNVLSLLQG